MAVSVTSIFLFLSTPSARRATDEDVHSQLKLCISIHALREEGDVSAFSTMVSLTLFLSTPSARRATPLRVGYLFRHSYFYPRPPRGGRPALRDSCGLIRLISIHALREEGDRSPWKSLTFPRYFYPRPPRGGRLLEFCQCLRCFGISIHALREEGDRLWCEGGDLNPTFLSTPSARRATRPAINPRSISGDFYPRPPRGGRLATMTQCWQTWVFLSTPSARRAT